MRQRVSCHRKALDLLARRSHFERELERKLTQRGYEEVEVAETLERLRGEDLLDDERTARELIRGRLARAPVGRNKLRADLVRRGVPSEIIDGALEALTPDDDLELAREAAERWRRTRERPGRPAEQRRAALGRHLAGRGFSRRGIFAVLQEIPWHDDAAADDGHGPHDDPVDESCL